MCVRERERARNRGRETCVREREGVCEGERRCV